MKKYITLLQLYTSNIRWSPLHLYMISKFHSVKTKSFTEEAEKQNVFIENSWK